MSKDGQSVLGCEEKEIWKREDSGKKSRSRS